MEAKNWAKQLALSWLRTCSLPSAPVIVGKLELRCTPLARLPGDHHCLSVKTTKAGELAEDICKLHGLKQHIHIPTRGPNTLDLILSDFSGDVTVTGHPPLGASAHACLLAIIPAPALRERLTKRTVWHTRRIDLGCL